MWHHPRKTMLWNQNKADINVKIVVTDLIYMYNIYSEQTCGVLGWLLWALVEYNFHLLNVVLLYHASLYLHCVHRWRLSCPMTATSADVVTLPRCRHLGILSQWREPVMNTGDHCIRIQFWGQIWQESGVFSWLKHKKIYHNNSIFNSLETTGSKTIKIYFNWLH